MKAVHEGLHRWSSIAQVDLQQYCSCGRPKKVFWVCVAKSHHEGEAKDSSSARDSFKKARTDTQDYYTLLGISSDASSRDIKVAFRQLARKYHPDVNNDSGAGDTFKTILNAYETLSEKTSKDAYDHSLRARAHAAKRTHRSYEKRSMYGRRAGASYWSAMNDENIFDWDSLGNTRREEFGDYFHGGKDFNCEEESEASDRQGGPFLREGWADSIVDVLMVFCLVGFIWHTLGAQLALTYFVFFIPHNTEHTPWYRFASLVAWLIGGTKGLALHYGLVTTGWLYGKSHDMISALGLLVFWMESIFPHVFAVPRGAILLLAHICLGGLQPF